MRNLNELDVPSQRVIDDTVGLGGLEIFPVLAADEAEVMASQLRLDVVSKPRSKGGSPSLSGGRVARDGREN